MESNNYGIPAEVLEKIKKEDTDCVYCHKKMIYPWDPNNREDCATIEHLNHKKDWDSVGSYLKDGKPIREIIAMCCWSCNTNRRDKSLRDWFETPFCKEKNINYSTVAPVVKNYIDKYEK